MIVTMKPSQTRKPQKMPFSSVDPSSPDLPITPASTQAMTSSAPKVRPRSAAPGFACTASIRPAFIHALERTP